MSPDAKSFETTFQYFPFWENSPYQDFSKPNSFNHPKLDHFINVLYDSDIDPDVIKQISDFFRSLVRSNRRISTIQLYFHTLKRFLFFAQSLDIKRFELIDRNHIGAFIEFLQDQDLAVSTINSYLIFVYSFFKYLAEKNIVSPNILENKFRLKMPDPLPRAIDPSDIKQLLSAIDTVRERALVTMLLRTGMRIGELLGTKLADINFTEKKIEIFQAQKNDEGRIVYMSDDACTALKAWLQQRKLSDKGYTLHCLRHTYASELLNAGMRLECLQVLLGHQDIEVTRRYARLTDNTRKEEYFRAMGRIERGEIDGHYRRFLKRKNCSKGTVKNYINCLKHFVVWVNVPIEKVSNHHILIYIEHLLKKRLKPKTINNNLDSIRGFYNFLLYEENMAINNPVKKGYSLRLAKPLPKHLKDEEVTILFEHIHNFRDQAIFMLMLRCGLRVAEVADLTLNAIDMNTGQILVFKGKGSKGRVVYFSKDTYDILSKYLKNRKSSRVQSVFLVEKGIYKGKGISVRGIQKRIEYYSKKSGVSVSCHHLRHTMATQLLNADADLVTIQDLLGHNKITTTQRYCKVSNLKIQRDYDKAMEHVLQR